MQRSKVIFTLCALATLYVSSIALAQEDVLIERRQQLPLAPGEPQPGPPPNSLLPPSEPGPIVRPLPPAGARMHLPELSPDDRRVHELMERWHRTSESDEKTRREIKEGLLEALSSQFDAGQKRREDEIRMLNEHLRKLREMHTKRAAEKSTIVERRMEDLLRTSDGLGWEESPQGGPFFFFNHAQSIPSSSLNPGLDRMWERPVPPHTGSGHAIIRTIPLAPDR